MSDFIFLDISSYSQGLVSLIIGIICLKNYANRPDYIKVLGFYGLNSFVFQLSQESTILFFQNHYLNEIGNVYVLSECIILSFLFYFVIPVKTFRKAILFLILLYIFVYILAFLIFHKSAPAIIRSTRDLLIVIFCISYFFYLLRDLPEDDLMQVPMFWINSAILVFFSGTFILSYFREYIIVMIGDGIADYWTFRNFFRFAFCLVLVYAGWLNLKSIRATQRLN